MGEITANVENIEYGSRNDFVAGFWFNSYFENEEIVFTTTSTEDKEYKITVYLTDMPSES